MTFLELVQRLHTQVGALGNVPSTVDVASLRNEDLRMVQWISQANDYVQALWSGWNFLRVIDFPIDTVADTRDITAPAMLDRWDLATFKINGDPLEAVEYDGVRADCFDLDTTNIPSRVVVLPNNNLRFDPIPDTTYNVTADYIRSPVPLVNNDDVSPIPARFHSNVILGRAMVLYGNFENAAEMVQQGQDLFEGYIGQLESSQLPNQGNARFSASGADIQVSAR